MKTFVVLGFDRSQILQKVGTMKASSRQAAVDATEEGPPYKWNFDTVFVLTASEARRIGVAAKGKRS